MYLFTSGTRAEGHVNVLWVREEEGDEGENLLFFFLNGSSPLGLILPRSG